MIRLSIPATSARNVGGTVYVAVAEGGKCKVARLRGGSAESVVSVPGSPCVLLWGRGGELLISAGSTLYLVSGSEARPVLRAGAGNWFWHAAECCGAVFVQEYGEPPTGIYASEDLASFRRVVTNVDVDPTSRHFHYVAFDRDRELLIFGQDDVREALTREPALTPHAALLERVRGAAYAVKRGLWRFWP